MKQKNPAPFRSKNPWSTRRHRKEVLWQITIPLIIGAVVLLAAAALSARMSLGETRRWADISLIWLIAPVMFLGLISLITLVGSIFALIKLIQVLPIYSYRLQRGLIQVQVLLGKLSDRSVEPAIRLEAFTASTKRLFRLLIRR